MPTREELVALRDDCLADDVEIDDEMLSWSIEACREYFESGGTVKPVDISEMEQGDTLALGRRHRSAPSMELAASRRTGVSGCAPAWTRRRTAAHAPKSE